MWGAALSDAICAARAKNTAEPHVGEGGVRINGARLTDGDERTIRMALNSLVCDLKERKNPCDAPAVALVANHIVRIFEIWYGVRLNLDDVKPWVVGQSHE